MSQSNLVKILKNKKDKITQEIEGLERMYEHIKMLFQSIIGKSLEENNDLIKTVNTRLIFMEVKNYLRFDICKKYGLDQKIPIEWRKKIIKEIKSDIETDDYFGCSVSNDYLTIYPNSYSDWEIMNKNSIEFRKKEYIVGSEFLSLGKSDFSQAVYFLPFYNFKPNFKNITSERNYSDSDISDINSDLDSDW